MRRRRPRAPSARGSGRRSARPTVGRARSFRSAGAATAAVLVRVIRRCLPGAGAVDAVLFTPQDPRTTRHRRVPTSHGPARRQETAKHEGSGKPTGGNTGRVPRVDLTGISRDHVEGPSRQGHAEDAGRFTCRPCADSRNARRAACLGRPILKYLPILSYNRPSRVHAYLRFMDLVEPISPGNELETVRPGRAVS